MNSRMHAQYARHLNKHLFTGPTTWAGHTGIGREIQGTSWQGDTNDLTQAQEQGPDLSLKGEIQQEYEWAS